MAEVKKCKACSASVHVNDEEIQKAIDRLLKTGKVKFVNDDVYMKRLSECGKCSHLEYKTTCMLCGCLVALRAKLATGTCPFPKASKWK